MAFAKLKSSKYFWLLVVAVAVAVVVIAAAWALHKGPFSKPEPQPTSAASFNTKGESGASGSSEQSSNNSDKQSSNAGSSNLQLFTPTGNFVSNHHPNLSGSPAPNTLTSACNTTPGATCEIIFTKGNVTKSLSLTKTDGNGAAFWTWKLQDVGLTEGTWKITAVAHLNSDTKSAIDALDLVVMP